MAFGFELIEHFLDFRDNPKRTACAAYMARSGEKREQLKSLKTDMKPVHVPVGDKIRAALPAIMAELDPLREAVEAAPGMLDLEEDRLFRNERAHWIRQMMDSGVTLERPAAGPVRQPEMV